MTGFIRLAFISLFSGLASASIVHQKYKSASYSAYASQSFDGGCSSDFSSYFSASVSSTDSKFQLTPGKTGYKSTDKFDYIYLYFDLFKCSSNTVKYRYGYHYDSSYYGSPDFTLEFKKLMQASLTNVQVAVFERTCDIVCSEFCYAEYYYGTCPPEEPITVCYADNCSDDNYLGTADVNIVWKVASGTTSSPEQGSSTSRDRSSESSYMYRSKGSYRLDVPVTVTVKIDGKSQFFTTPSYSNGELYSSTYSEMYKYSG